MPSYRLLAGSTTVIDTFDAVDDGEAIDRAHELSLDFPCEAGTFIARWGYYRLDRQEGQLWQLLFAWVPHGRPPDCP
jgi:hypothetical protein